MASPDPLFYFGRRQNIIFFVISVVVEDYRHFFETFFTRSMVNCCAIFLAMCKQIPRSVLLLNLLAQAFKACSACTKAKNLARPASKKNTSASAGFSNYRGGQSHDFSRGGVQSEHFNFLDHFKSVTYQLTLI